MRSDSRQQAACRTSQRVKIGTFPAYSSPARHSMEAAAQCVPLLMTSRFKSLLVVLLIAIGGADWPCAAEEAGTKATAYQARLQALHERAQVLAEKRHFANVGGVKPTDREKAEWLSVTGELYEISPYWRFHRQLVEEMAAMTEAPGVEPELWQKSQDRYFEFLKIVVRMQPAATQEQAKAEVYQLRNAFIKNDLKAARRLAELNARRGNR